MNKLLLALMVIVGVGVATLSFADDRTIVMKSKGVRNVPTLISASGATVYSISGYAAESNCTYSVHDVASIAGNQMTASNVKAEGGEATQYDSFPNLNFGTEGLPFDTGVAVFTETCDLTVQYR